MALTISLVGCQIFHGRFDTPTLKAKDSYTTGQEDQKITLTNADFVGGSTSDQQIIQELVTKDKLIVDS